MNLKTSSLIAVFCALTLTLQAGLFFDDPLEVQSQHIPHTFSKDEIHFTTTGKCRGFVLLEAEMSLELTYSTGRRVLVANQTVWGQLHPLKFTLPDNLAGLQSYRLTGKVRAVMTPSAGQFTGDTKKDWKVIDGYSKKVDLKWTVK
jgi:hypothetical protein